MDRNNWIKIWFYVLAIIVFGLAALYSASYENIRVSRQVFFDQLHFCLLGIFLMFFLGRIDYRKFYDAAYIFYFINLLLLLFVLFSGRHILGARRWIEVGVLNFQPSEIAKLSLILVLARYFTSRKPFLIFSVFSMIRGICIDFLVPLFITGVYMLLIYAQPDLGTALLLFGVLFAMLFVSGIDGRYIGFFSLLFSAAILLCFFWEPLSDHVLKPYQKDRLLVFLNPNRDPLGAGYTIIQSKIAVGSGQIFGKGWLSGTQNQLNFLPERHTDFIFSVIGEEWGLIGALILLFLYLRLILVCLNIAENIRERFGILLSSGITAILALQVVINIGMVIGLFPIVGITLPLVSYGRSSFLVFMIFMGFMLNLSRKRSIF
ncbi:MAG: rod shape-determining protein RodA [Candidatus Omnitrophica bacterium]|nr:rod shape-determining protein RodA [Candidatus Omnitrophota bacterium]